MTGAARDLGLPCVHYLRKQMTLADLSSGNVLIGTLPAGSFVLNTFARIDTIFNATTTNVLTVGTNAAVNDLAGSADITEGSQQQQAIVPPGTGVTPTSDVDVFAKYTQSGTPATTGQATIIVAYVPLRPTN